MTSDPHYVAGRLAISIVPRHRYVPAGRTAMVTENRQSSYPLSPPAETARQTTEKEAQDQTGG
jgi:hypothetical protein